MAGLSIIIPGSLTESCNLYTFHKYVWSGIYRSGHMAPIGLNTTITNLTHCMTMGTITDYLMYRLQI